MEASLIPLQNRTGGDLEAITNGSDMQAEGLEVSPLPSWRLRILSKSSFYLVAGRGQFDA